MVSHRQIKLDKTKIFFTVNTTQQVHESSKGYLGSQEPDAIIDI